MKNRGWILAGVVVLVLILIFAVSWYDTDDVISGGEIPASVVAEEIPELTASENSMELAFKNFPLTFTLPSGWSLLSDPSLNDEGVIESVKIQVPDSAYEVSLTMDVQEVEDSVDFYDGETLENGVDLSSHVCGGCRYSFGLSKDGHYYWAAFTVSSTEPVPENLDGIWVPSIDLSEEAVREFLATVR